MFAIQNETHEDCVLAVSVVGKTRVVSCPNPADAASPVTLDAGAFSKPIGQSADYRHHLDGLMSVYGAALVQTWWRDGVWETTIDGADQHEGAIREFVRRCSAERQVNAEREIREANEAARKKQDSQKKAAVEKVVAIVTEVAEQWAPGRISVKVANDGEVIVGRWAAPFIPGHGMPVEVRAAAGKVGAISLVPTSDSYRYLWH